MNKIVKIILIILGIISMLSGSYLVFLCATMAFGYSETAGDIVLGSFIVLISMLLILGAMHILFRFTIRRRLSTMDYKNITMKEKIIWTISTIISGIGGGTVGFLLWWFGIHMEGFPLLELFASLFFYSIFVLINMFKRKVSPNKIHAVIENGKVTR